MATLLVEFFDTDQSSYKHCLEISLKSPGSFYTNEPHTLRIDAADGTTRFVPLIATKQYYEKDTAYHVHQWSLDHWPVDEITEETCACGASRQTIHEHEPDGATTRITLFEPVTHPPAEAEADDSDTSPSILVNELLRRTEIAGIAMPENIKAEPIGNQIDFLLEVLGEAAITRALGISDEGESNSTVRVEPPPSKLEPQFTNTELQLILDTFALYLQDRNVQAHVPDIRHPEYQNEKDLWAKASKLLALEGGSVGSGTTALEVARLLSQSQGRKE